MQYHRIRELAENGELELVKVHTKENQADALTKAPPRKGLWICMMLIGTADQKDFNKALGHQRRDCKLKVVFLKLGVGEDGVSGSLGPLKLAPSPWVSAIVMF